MPRNNNNGQNNRNNRANNRRVSSDNEEQLELIKINVDKVKKDVSEISVHTRKEISAITKKMDELISTMEKSMKVVASQTTASAKTMQQMNEQQMKSLAAMNDLVNDRIDAEKKITNQKKEQTKESQKQSKNDDNNKNKGGFSSETTDNWLKNYNDKKGNTDRILDAIKGKSSALFTHKTDKAMDDIVKKMREVETSNASFSQKEKELDILTNQYKSLDASAEKLKAASAVFDTAVKVIKNFADVWIKRFENGLNNVANTYEQLYQQQAVLTGINESQYQQAQKDMRDNIKQMGLQDNIAVTDVMEQTAGYVSQGITDFGKASEMGQTAAIGKVLAPYLDQQSDAFVSMSTALGPSFSKSMIGMGKYVSEETGQNRFITKNLNSIISMMEPIVMASNKQIMGEEEFAQVEALMKKGYTESESLQTVSKAMDAVRNPSGALDNGDLSTRIQIANGNYTDISKFIAGDIQTTTDLVKGTTGLARSLVANAVSSMGYKYYLQSDEQNQEQADTAAEYAKEDALRKPSGATGSKGDDTEPKESIKTYKDMLQSLGDGNFTTAKQEKDILAENLSVDLAIYKEKWPDLFEVINNLGKDIIAAIGIWIGGKLIGNFGGKLLGKIGSKLFGKTVTKTAGNIIGGEQLSLFGNTAKTGLGSKIGSGLKAAFTTTGKSGLTSVLSSTGAKVLGGVGGAIMTVKDAVGGYNKADQWFEKDNNGQPATTGQKVSSAIGGALGGTGPGVFDEGASTGDKVKNVLGGAAKGAMIGTMFGPIGTAVGGLVGAGLSALGGEKISKGLSKLGERIKDTASKVGETVNKMWDSAKEGFGKLADNAASAFGDFVNFLTGIPEKLVKGLKWGIDSFMTATQNMFSALLNIPIFIANSAIGLVNGIKNSLKSLAVGIADKIGQGNNVASWFPEDMPTLEYSKIQSMPDISSYATGTDYVKANGQFAYLHEGEAVLTKSAATLLRTQTSENISTASGVNSALEANSSVSKEYITTIVTAINDQTAALIAKMDEIYQKMIASSYRGKYSASLVGLKANQQIGG